VAQVPAGEAFSEKALHDIGKEVREISEQAKVVFSVLVADPDDFAGSEPDVRAFAEKAHAALGDRAHESVLILVAPNARRVEIVLGTSLRGRLSDRDCALAALSMTSTFAGGDLTGGVLQGVRMLGQRTGAPRRRPSVVAPGRKLSELLKS
jgi:uncharacterized membrane protein YgcG